MWWLRRAVVGLCYGGRAAPVRRWASVAGAELGGGGGGGGGGDRGGGGGPLWLSPALEGRVRRAAQRCNELRASLDAGDHVAQVRRLSLSSRPFPALLPPALNPLPLARPPCELCAQMTPDQLAEIAKEIAHLAPLAAAEQEMVAIKNVRPPTHPHSHHRSPLSCPPWPSPLSSIALTPVFHSPLPCLP